MPTVPFPEGTTPEQQKAIRERQAAEAKRREEEHQQSIDAAVQTIDVPALERLWNIEVTRACHNDGPSRLGLGNLDRLTTAAATWCTTVGIPNGHLRRLRILIAEFQGPASFDRYAFGHSPKLTELRLAAAAEIGDLRILHETTSLRVIRQKSTPQAAPSAPSAPTPVRQSEGPVAKLGNGGPKRTFDALCECMRKVHHKTELHAGLRISLSQAQPARDASDKANDYMSPKGKLSAGGWIRRDGEFIELTEQGATEAARRAAGRLAKPGKGGDSGR